MTKTQERLVRFLRWSEKYTKTDMVYLASGGFWSTAGQIVASITALVLSVAMARYVSKDVYGQYKYILAIISILTAFSLNGIGSAVLQSAASGFNGALSDGFWANLRWSFVIFVGAFVLGAYYVLVGNATLGIGILLGGCATPFLTGFSLYGSFLAGKKDFIRQAWYGNAVTNIIPAIALIATAYIAPRPLPLLVVYFVANIAAAGYAYIRSAKRYPETAAAARDPHMLSYSKHLSLIGILSGIANNIDQLLLFHFTSAVDLAVYNFATGIIDQAKGLTKSLDGMLQARFVMYSDTTIMQSMRNKYFWLFVGSVITVVVYILLAPFIYHVLFPAYAVAISYSQVYALSLISFALLPAGSYLVAKKKVRAQYWSTVGGSILQIVILVIGVIGWGLWGIVIARVISRFALNILTYCLAFLE